MSTMPTYAQRAFTVVELLIVTVVIAILATIAIVSYNGIRTRAQVVSVSAGLRQVDKSFRIWAIDDGFNAWPLEPTYSGGTKLSNMIIDNPGLQANLQNVPEVTGVGTEEWFYDNDVIDPGSSQCGNAYHGTNIVIKYIKEEAIAVGVDKTIDDGNTSCGIVKWDSTEGILFYSLGYDKMVGTN